ncbi:MAG: AbrB/MazE/SpoVT family DNA-binding domain-containing protein [Patescibacteria group bacterium]|nr:AbrB/MazE/SpoVT family DNA-binding domain-containing protein [Patescibacteria group bacterium]
MNTVATVTSKGQVTIPKIARDVLLLDEGDKLVFLVLPDLGFVKVFPLKNNFLSQGASIKPLGIKDIHIVRSKTLNLVAKKVAAASQ